MLVGISRYQTQFALSYDLAENVLLICKLYSVFYIISLFIYVIKVCQWFVTGQWFSSGTPVSSTNKTDHHDITKILKVALNTINLNQTIIYLFSVNNVGVMYEFFIYFQWTMLVWCISYLFIFSEQCWCDVWVIFLFSVNNVGVIY